jgi:thiosulfate/3-mercaptopyruvate sulfurtransferase
LATTATASWVKYWIEVGDIYLLDPRTPQAYADGHLPGAVNLPLEQVLDPNQRLLPYGQLLDVFGEAGIDDAKRPVVYDASDGTRGVMLAWVLEYLGRGDVSIMSILYEGWAAEGHAVSKEPSRPPRREFVPRIDPSKRATLDLLQAHPEFKLLDLRSGHEFHKSGHIPGAINLPWTELTGQDNNLLADLSGLPKQLASAGITKDDTVVTYDSFGPRAAMGYLALKHSGYTVRVFPGGFLQWREAGLAVEA